VKVARKAFQRVGWDRGARPRRKVLVEQVKVSETAGGSSVFTDQRDLDLIREDVRFHAASGKIGDHCTGAAPPLNSFVGPGGGKRAVHDWGAVAG